MAAGDIFNDFDKWQDEDFWLALDGGTGIKPAVDTSSRRSKLCQDVKEAIVVSNAVLTAEGELQKRRSVLNCLLV